MPENLPATEIPRKIDLSQAIGSFSSLEIKRGGTSLDILLGIQKYLKARSEQTAKVKKSIEQGDLGEKQSTVLIFGTEDRARTSIINLLSENYAPKGEYSPSAATIEHEIFSGKAQSIWEYLPLSEIAVVVDREGMTWQPAILLITYLVTQQVGDELMKPGDLSKKLCYFKTK